MTRRHTILEAFDHSPAVERLVSGLPSRGGVSHVSGAHGSSGVAAIASIAGQMPNRVFVLVAANPVAADELEADLAALIGHDQSVQYPQRESLPYEAGEPHLEIGGLRVEAVESLLGRRARFLVTTLRGLQERAPVPDELADLRFSIEEGASLPLQSLVAALGDRGFERVPLVEQVGQFAVRGGIVDAYSFGCPAPVRIEFWGDEVSSLRFFDILDQRSTGITKRVHLLPVDFQSGSGEDAIQPRSLLELLPADSILTTFGIDDWEKPARSAWVRANELYTEVLETGVPAPSPDELLLPPDEFIRAVASFGQVSIGSNPGGDLDLQASPPPIIDRKMDRLHAVLREGEAEGFRTLILCGNEGQLQRLDEILSDAGGIPPNTHLAIGALGGGFELRHLSSPLRVLTDHEIFRRHRRIRRSRGFRGGVALESLAQLKPGDHVVHMDHGIGRFRGLERVVVGGQEIEALAIEYDGGEVLRVPVDRLETLDRWVGASEDAKPKRLHRIGGKRWKALKKKTQEAIERMTAELLELYARREVGGGFAFSPDTPWQREMESSFLYEDTPDQKTATEDVKRDMQSLRPMDRLLCGDVGYGKTEVAMRAAFKAVQDGKQVAMIAPTTILVEQHRRTFEERLADFPIRIAALSRFRKPSEQREILADLASGRLDILVGTHRALGTDVKFHDLGLLIVDEEQRFGVRHKERLKQLRSSVDVLTLTATPIPRTLYLSLTGIRDLSLIQTPPRDRMPVLTHVLPWHDHLIRDALGRELDRAGQVFFLHNRVETIHTVAARVAELAPGARIFVAHGQMPAAELNQVMRDFVNGEVDILVCTSIIENGLDVANANTLVVDGADRFGLAQLYQIRGRVGRSDRRAYCYLLVPEEAAPDAVKRLRILEHYSELGSGYHVAVRDLEMRGAGNLLGADQSGFAHQVGIDSYLRLMERTIQSIREGEGAPDEHVTDVSIDGSAYIPDPYISDSAQKLHLYRRLSRIESETEVDALTEELRDRYGILPEEVERLLLRTRLALLGRAAGVARIFVSDREARIHFTVGRVPRLAPLEKALEDHAVEVRVARMTPLVLVLSGTSGVALPSLVAEGLRILARERSVAA